jgi:hypothetical protein
MVRVAILGVLVALASGCGNKDDIPTPPVHIGMGSSAGAATGSSGDGSAGATSPSSGSVTPSSGTLVGGMTSGSSGTADGG